MKGKKKKKTMCWVLNGAAEPPSIAGTRAARRRREALRWLWFHRLSLFYVGQRSLLSLLSTV